MEEPIAHRRSCDFEVHFLDRHLLETARQAAVFARPFKSESWASLAGLWHDLGKYQPAFQRYIRTDTESPLEVVGKVDHASVGAIYACDRLPGQAGRVLAYLIAGHHGGLPDWSGAEPDVPRLEPRLGKRELLDTALATVPPTSILDAPLPGKPPGIHDIALWVRMLFSCLVDADFLDTEAFMQPDKTALRTPWPGLDELAPRFDAYIARFTAHSPVNRIRAEVLARCRKAAERAPGLFSLTVPTGGGKTLASLAFALDHAKRHGKRRIIYVIPYTSIIEQTADVFRRIFGDAVLEHHSNLDPDRESVRSRLAAENWDAPIVVTTAVQFFESLFAFRPSRCRKLHNIVDSVVVLDEVQLLPVEFIKPILAAIQELSRHYGVTFLLMTATQPALNSRDTGEGRFQGLDGVYEIIDNPDALHEALRRFRLQLPDDLRTPCDWNDLARELAQYEQVLCIVNRRDDARLLAELMPPDTVHLSAQMCGRHRSVLIRWIRRRLARGLPVRVVSTQLVEAGVDLDFPVVYRALAGLDSIAQAGGRCNREGRLSGLGLVVVFVPPSTPPPGILRQGADVARTRLAHHDDDPLAPARFPEYFHDLFWQQGDRLDKHGICKLLKPNGSMQFSFATAAKRFRLIDSDYVPVVVRCGRRSHVLLETLKTQGPQRWLLRRLQRYTVNIPRKSAEHMHRQGALLEIEPGLYVQGQEGLYHNRFGLLLDPVVLRPASELVV